MVVVGNGKVERSRSRSSSIRENCWETKESNVSHQIVVFTFAQTGYRLQHYSSCSSSLCPATTTYFPNVLSIEEQNFYFNSIKTGEEDHSETLK